MRSRLLLTLSTAAVAGVLGLSVAAVPAHAPSAVMSGVNPHMQSIGPLAIGPSGILYAADPQAATIVALDLSTQKKGAPGRWSRQSRTGSSWESASPGANGEISITDLKVDPATHNSFVSVMRGQGANASPALLRVDGAGKIDVIALDGLKFSSVALPNAPDANPASGRSNRTSRSRIRIQRRQGVRGRPVERRIRVEVVVGRHPFRRRIAAQRRDLPRLTRQVETRSPVQCSSRQRGR
jgi:hypothetical protein